jgi:hypothetical protein
METIHNLPNPQSRETNQSHEARPINMLPPYEKLLELVIHQQLPTYLEDNNLLYSQQFGFRKNKSTEQALQVLLSNWRHALNEGKFIIAVSIDLKCAFQTISRHIILLTKLSLHGIQQH